MVMECRKCIKVAQVIIKNHYTLANENHDLISWQKIIKKIILIYS